MLLFMRTTIHIADALYRQAKTLAAQQGTTIKALVETALRRLLAGQSSSNTPFKLKEASFQGQGLQEGLSESDWASIRNMTYEGRGG